jgi:hypothetical protein
MHRKRLTIDQFVLDSQALNLRTPAHRRITSARFDFGILLTPAGGVGSITKAEFSKRRRWLPR